MPYYIGSTASSTSNGNHGGNQFKEPNIPFRDWDLESVCAWMEHLLGFQSYAVGKKHALKKYDRFALNTSCFWGIIMPFHEFFVTKVIN